MTALLEAGIDHFIDLTAEGELAPYLEIAREQAVALGWTWDMSGAPFRPGSAPQP